MNKVILAGTIVRDPDIKGEGNNKVARFSLALRRNFKDKEGKYGADFPNCVAFGKSAELIEKYFKKGSWIGVTGRINTGSYTNKDGQKVYTTDVAVNEVDFVGGKNSSEATKPTAEDQGFMNIPDGVDDSPFG